MEFVQLHFQLLTSKVPQISSLSEAIVTHLVSTPINPFFVCFLEYNRKYQ